MSKKKHHRVVVKDGPSGAARSQMDTPLYAGLRRADGLIEAGKLLEAMPLLRDLDMRYPDRPDVLFTLLDVTRDLKRFDLFEGYAERLARLLPDDVDVHAALAGAYLANDRFGMALQAFRGVVARWPEDADAEEARKTLDSLEKLVRDFIERNHIPREGAVELVVLHDEALRAVERGQFAAARGMAERILERHPRFASALNNLGLAYFAEGRLAEALDAARRVLAFDPGNIHALGNSVRVLLLEGREDEAVRMAERMKRSRADAHDRETKMAEALHLVGDDAGVWDAYQQAKRTGYPAGPLLLHLAAVSAFRLGHEAEARRLWRDALEQDPTSHLAGENLADLSKPAGERSGPWPLSLGSWLPGPMIEELARSAEDGVRRDREAGAQEGVRAALAARPGWNVLLPRLLERGDPEGRMFAFQTAMAAGAPETLAALRDFALGRWGPDALRAEAAQTAAREGLLPRTGVRLWWNGKQGEMRLAGWEIYSEPIRRHSDRVRKMAEQAHHAMRSGRLDEAEQLYAAALDAEPDSPDILNNLAVLCTRLGKAEEAAALLEENDRRFPDYFFGRVSRALRLIEAGQLDDAKDAVDGLMQQDRFHTSEFAALANAQIRLNLKSREWDEARNWLETWEEMAPGTSGLEEARRDFEAHERTRLLWKPGGRKKANRR